MLERRTFPVGRLQCNCTILHDKNTDEGIIIDPGDEPDVILDHLQNMGIKTVKAMVHTHAHIDHVGATGVLEKILKAPVYLHDGDKFLYEMLHMQAKFLGYAETPERCTIDHGLPDQLAISFGKYELGTLHTPGHTPGSVCFVVPNHDLCFTGDTLFRGGIGRTDLWGGDGEEIVRSIKNKLYTLNDAVNVVPGHGPETSIEHEKRKNAFVRT